MSHSRAPLIAALTGVVLAVLVMAAAVFLVSRSQRETFDANFREAQLGQRLAIEFLEQDRAVDHYLVSRETSALGPYVQNQASIPGDLAAARRVSADDAMELSLLRAQTLALQRWGGLARRQIDGERAGAADERRADVQARERAAAAYLAANAGYRSRLDVNRRTEEDQASLVPVWTTLTLGGLLALVGAILGWRMTLSRRRRRAAEVRAARDENAFITTQGRFSEAMQVAQSQGEAHGLLGHHLERTIPDAAVIVLNRNNSDDRLEASPELPAGHTLDEPLAQARPRTCLAVRLSRRYERGADAEEILQCELCGELVNPSTCQPLLVGGSVIGSVLVEHHAPLVASERRRVEDSVAQAAPVLANLRNLAIAETRAATDTLTGLPNRRAVDDTLRRMVAQAGRQPQPLSVIVLDLDHFKTINDTMGHQRGDDVLAALGLMLRNELRDSDFAGRTGGEEFVVFLPDTDRPGALGVAENLRRAVHAIGTRDMEHDVTASFGVSTFPADATDGETLLRCADRALYTAKQSGRDRVETTSTGRTLLADEDLPPALGTPVA